MQQPTVLKKVVIVIIGLFAFGALGGVFLAGLNMFNRAISEQSAPAQVQPSAQPSGEAGSSTPDKKP